MRQARKAAVPVLTLKHGEETASEPARSRGALEQGKGAVSDWRSMYARDPAWDGGGDANGFSVAFREMSVAVPSLERPHPRWGLVEEVARRDHELLLRRGERRFARVERGRLEECLQAAYLDAREGASAGSVAEMRAFVARAFTNNVLDLLKSFEHARTTLVDELPLDTESSMARAPDALVDDKLTAAMLKDAVASLSERSRAVVRLRFEDGFDICQVCALLGISKRQYAKSVNRALRTLLQRMESIGTPAYCEEVKRPVHRYATGTATVEEAARARSHLAWCGACASHVATLRAHMRAGAALVPAPMLIKGHGPLAGWLLDGAHTVKAHAATLAGRSGTASDGASSASQVAAAGGTRGAGGLVAAKLVTLCIGGAAAAGGAAYCVQQTVDPIGGLTRIVAPAHGKHRAHIRQVPRASEALPTPPVITTSPPPPPQQQPTPASEQRPATQPAPPPQPSPGPEAEFGPEGSGGGAPPQSSSASRKPAPAPANGPGEFGP